MSPGFQVVRPPQAPRAGRPAAPLAPPGLPSAWSRFAALVGYELLCSLRRRKVLAMTAIAALLVGVQVLLPGLLAALDGRSLDPDPDHAISVGRSFGSDIFASPFILFFAIAVAMDVIPLEFENGSIATLLSKPVTRRTVLAAKWTGVVLVLALVYAFLFLFALAGAWAVYGPQEGLELYPLLVLGSLLAILVYTAIVFALGAAFRSSLIAAIGGFGAVFALVFLTFGLSGAGFPEAALVLPGPGPTGFVVDPGEPAVPMATPGRPGTGPGPDNVNLGTHMVGGNVVYALRHPGKEVALVEAPLGLPGTVTFPEEVLREPLDQAVARSALLAVGYIAGLLAIAWWRFARAEALG